MKSILQLLKYFLTLTLLFVMYEGITRGLLLLDQPSDLDILAGFFLILASGMLVPPIIYQLFKSKGDKNEAVPNCKSDGTGVSSNQSK